jgi:hypothetical protein
MKNSSYDGHDPMSYDLGHPSSHGFEGAGSLVQSGKMILKTVTTAPIPECDIDECDPKEYGIGSGDGGPGGKLI